MNRVLNQLRENKANNANEALSPNVDCILQLTFLTMVLENKAKQNWDQKCVNRIQLYTKEIWCWQAGRLEASQVDLIFPVHTVCADVLTMLSGFIINELCIYAFMPLEPSKQKEVSW